MSLVRLVSFTAAVVLLLTGSAQAQRHHHEKHEEPQEQKPKAEPPPPVQTASHDELMAPKGPARVDFDDRLLQGQTNRLGAVYLYQRKDPVLPSLLDRRKSFRAEIKRDVLE